MPGLHAPAQSWGAQMLMVYGAGGYTGRLIVQEALRRQHRPILAGRRRSAFAELAHSHQLEVREMSLETPEPNLLHGVTALINAAGPFVRTQAPLIGACVRAGVHYLDLAGEVAEIRAAYQADAAARSAGIALVSDTGFGVVPTDCLAAQVAANTPGAIRLQLAMQTVGGVSRGTLATLLASLGCTGHVYRDGQLVAEHAAVRELAVDFGNGTHRAVSNPWRGDLFTAPLSTGVTNVETYMVLPQEIVWLMRRPGAAGIAKAAFKAIAGLVPEGPSDEQIAAGSTAVWARAERPDGSGTEALLQGPEAYQFTAITAVRAYERVASGAPRVGFLTPSQLFGTGFLASIPEVTVHERI